MASKNKMNKSKNAYCNHGSELKESTMRIKRLLYFTPSMRKRINKINLDYEIE